MQILVKYFLFSAVGQYDFSLRACASAALKDVAAYFTKEQGQVAVSKRTPGSRCSDRLSLKTSQRINNPPPGCCLSHAGF